MAQAKRRVAKTQSKKKKPNNARQTVGAIGFQLSKLFAELLFLGAILLGFVVFLALVSYSEQDPAWTHVTSPAEVQNLLGTSGAYMADILFFVLGWVAYLLPIIICVWGWSAAKNRKSGLFDLEAFLFRTLGGIVTIVGLAGLAHLWLPVVSAYAPGGGVLGDLISTGLVNSFGVYLSGALLFAFVIAGITLVTAMGWGQIIKLLVGVFMMIVGTIMSLIPGRSRKHRQSDVDDDEIDGSGNLASSRDMSVQNIGYDDEPDGQDRAPNISAHEPVSTDQMRPQDVSDDREYYFGDHETKSSDTDIDDERAPESDLYNADRSVDDEQHDHAADELAQGKRPLSPFAFAAKFKGKTNVDKKPVPKPRIKYGAKPEQNPSADKPTNTTNTTNTAPQSSDYQPTTPTAPQQTAHSEAEDRSHVPSATYESDEPTPTEPTPAAQPTETISQDTSASEANTATSENETVPHTEPGEAVGVIPDRLDPLAEIERKKSKLSNGELPSIQLLDRPPPKSDNEELSEQKLKEKSDQLEQLLKSYGIEAYVKRVSAGPVITLYEIDPAPGVKVSQINNLSKDIARGLAVMSVRVLETIPGSTHIGIEVPNQKRETVYLRDIFESRSFREYSSPITLALGQDISGRSVVANLAKMPHLLVAGTTGSGKSVAVNGMLLSILYKSTPHEVRLIMIDPKMLELSIYNGIPHLLTPVVTDMKEAANSLKWCVTEMDRRYQLLAALKVRNIESFNAMVKAANERGEPIPNPLYKVDPTSQLNPEPPPLEPLPKIVVVIDELADMMMVVGKKVEELIARLAQKARAAGIHLILATQRPSVDVITGLIKANVPTRIAFQVSSRVDSRTILDTQGAENLLGNGDMLYMPPGSGQPHRSHGAFVDDEEVVRVVEFLKTTGEPEYIPDVTESPEDKEAEESNGDAQSEQDELYDEAVAIVTSSRKATISYLQRQLRIGFNRAARLVEDMQTAGVVTPPDSSGQREVVAPPPVEE